jgi:hypothetical protein
VRHRKWGEDNDGKQHFRQRCRAGGQFHCVFLHKKISIALKYRAGSIFHLEGGQSGVQSNIFYFH